MSDFMDAVQVVIAHEGGFSDHASDRGGETSYGISQAFLNSIGSNLRAREVTKAKAIELYLEFFWLPLNIGRISDQDVATFVLDSAVNHGNSTAAKILQEAINVQKPIVIDGVIGDQTIGACNDILSLEKGKEFLLDSLQSIRKSYYMKIVASKPDQRVFIRGWFNRVNDLVNHG